jgi:arylsulfatase A-like enzyme
MHGEHRIPGDKFLPYEESLRVPLIFRGPGVPKNKTIRGQVANVDFAPTLLHAAKAKSGRRMDGVSLLPTIRRPKRLPNRAIEVEALRPLFAGPIPQNQWDRTYKGVRTNRFTYVVWTETGETELYDRRLDPNQLQNVASDPSYAGIIARLAAKLVKLDSCGGKSCQVKP